jgi:hypothetical protein
MESTALGLALRGEVSRVYVSSIKGQIGFYFGRTTSDEKVKRIMQIKETIATDHGLFVATNHGTEGVPWTKKDGTVEQLIAGVGKGGSQGISDDEIPF